VKAGKDLDRSDAILRGEAGSHTDAQSEHGGDSSAFSGHSSNFGAKSLAFEGLAAKGVQRVYQS